MIKECILSILLGFGIAVSVVAESDVEAAKPETKQGSVAPEKAGDPAIELLRKIEEKNEDLKTLHGTFDQVREVVMFSERTESSGEFWYTKPNLFRCDYFEPSAAQFYMVNNTGYFYSPENKQLDKFTMESGDEAPINEMLVGFGLKTEKILEYFSVQLAPQQPEDSDLMTIDFISNDKNRTLDFQKITITFDEEDLEPRRIVMQEAEDLVEITLKKIKKNAEIPAKTYETDFGDDVTVYSASSE